MEHLFSDRTLLEQVAGGNEKAFRQLFDRYWKNIYGVALAFTKSPAVAEEMVQDIFLKVWLNRENLPGILKFEAYLHTIARNHILNELRKKVKEEPFTEHLLNYLKDVSSNPEQRIINTEKEQLVAAAINQLPAQQKAVFQLSREEYLSQEEISHRLQLSRHTIKCHMNKALKGIRGYMLKYSDEIIILLFCFQSLL